MTSADSSAKAAPRKPIALITGASSGIGLAFAHILASRGWHIIGVGRNRERLERLALDTHGEVLVADLLQPGDVERVSQRLREGVDLLINNAGSSTYGAFSNLDIDREVDQLGLHAVVPMRLCHAAAQSMNAGGRIINVASLAGLTASPGLASYAASKAALICLSEALHTELREFGIAVTCVCPGYTHTELQLRAGVDASALPRLMWSDAEFVARKALLASDKKKSLVTPGAINALSAALLRVLPRTAARHTAARTVALVRTPSP